MKATQVRMDLSHLQFPVEGVKLPSMSFQGSRSSLSAKCELSHTRQIERLTSTSRTSFRSRRKNDVTKFNLRSSLSLNSQSRAYQLSLSAAALIQSLTWIDNLTILRKTRSLSTRRSLGKFCSMPRLLTALKWKTPLR